MFNKNKTNKIALVGMVALGLFASEAPALAVAVDSNVYADFQSRRHSLILKETKLLRDYDSLQRRYDDMKRNNDGSYGVQLNDLASRIDKTYSDLRRTRQDLKEVEMRML